MMQIGEGSKKRREKCRHFNLGTSEQERIYMAICKTFWSLRAKEYYRIPVVQLMWSASF